VAADNLTVLVTLDVKGGGRDAFVMRCVVHEGHIYISPEKAPDPKSGIFTPWILRTKVMPPPIKKDNAPAAPKTAADTAKEKAVEEELGKMQGVWTAVSIERGGKALPKEDVKKLVLRLTVEGTSFALKTPDAEHFPHGTFRIDPSKKPKAIDFTVDRPFLLAGKTSTALGIYELDGDNLKLLQGRPGQQRPTEFKTTPESDLEIIVFKRATPMAEGKNSDK
jgi:uncharacterized protein (TIGR03067 family)